MASGHRSLESRRPSSPGNACGDSSVGNFSLLGQQFTHYNGAQHHQSWSPSPSSTLGFVLEAHLQQGTHSQQQPPSSHAVSQPQPLRSHSQSRPGENVVSAVSGYDGPAPAFPFPVGQDYNTVFGRQRLQESNVRGLEKMSTPDSSMFSAISPQALMSALSILQQKIQELQAMVQLIVQGGGQSPTALAQLQAMTTGVASVISQLVLATSGILQQSAVPATAIAADLQLSQLLGGAVGFGLHHLQQNGICNVLSPAQGNGHGNPFASVGTSRGGAANMSGDVGKSASLGGVHGGSGLGASGIGAPSLGGEGLDSLSRNFRSCLTFGTGNFLGNSFDVAGGANGGLNSGAGVGNKHEENAVGTHLIAHASGALQGPMEELDFGTGLRDEEDDGEGDNLPPGSYELVEMEAVEILAEHTHFCGICGKGFKRDANLRMHMRGHGDEYKTPAALARPDKPAQDTSTVRPRRYSCPFGGCKRNKKHRKFQPLKSILCVKNHYRRSHCPKILICRKCKTKKFSVVADLKTHEKHCGSDKWQCSCGTTFSRKDKLLGHIGLFVGHTPLHDLEGAGGGLTAGINGNDVFNAGNCSGIGTESVFQAPPGNNHFGYGNG